MMIFKGPITHGLSELVLSRSIEASRDENDAKARRSSFLLIYGKFGRRAVLQSQSRTSRRETDVTIQTLIMNERSPLAALRTDGMLGGNRGGGDSMQVRRALRASIALPSRPCDGLAALRSHCQRGFDVAGRSHGKSTGPGLSPDDVQNDNGRNALTRKSIVRQKR